MLGLGLQRGNNIAVLKKPADVINFYVAGEDSSVDEGGIYVYDEDFNYTNVFYDSRDLINSGSLGVIMPVDASPYPRDVAIDDNGKIYLLEEGYSKRIFRFNPDFTIDETFVSPDHYYISLVDEVTNIAESIEIDDDLGIILIGDRDNLIHEYQMDGTYNGFTDLSSLLENNLIGGLRLLNDKYYLTDKDYVYEFDKTWVFTERYWSTVFFDGSSRHGANNYGLVKTSDGWILPEIERDEINFYNINFEHVNSIPEDVNTWGIARSPRIKTGDSLAIAQDKYNGYFISFGEQVDIGKWNSITQLDQPKELLTSNVDVPEDVYFEMINPFVSIDTSGGLVLDTLPLTVMDSSFVLRGYESTNALVEFSGLDQAKLYTVRLYSNQVTDSTYVTDFWINGVKKSVENGHNTSEVVVYTDLTPDSNGKLQVEVNTEDNYAHLNAMILEMQS